MDCAMNTNGGRGAYICLMEGYWVVTVMRFDPAKIEEFGHDIVTAFVLYPRYFWIPNINL